MDLYLLNIIINVVWYVCATIFMLYRFTTFFSYMFNIVKFCGKLVTGTRYIFSLVSTPSGYERVPNECHTTNKTLFQKSKDYLYSFFRKGHTRSPDIIIPLYETQNSSYFRESQPFSNPTHPVTLQQEEINMFRKHYEDLCAQEEDEDSNPVPFQSVVLEANPYKPLNSSNLAQSSYSRDDEMHNPYL